MTAPLLVIVGETASGKSGLALELARRFNGEIICADSRTVYQGMDIGTAKPSVADQSAVPHFGLDLVTPAEPYTVADFKTYATDVIGGIQSRGKLPIMVGGSGLYIDAVLFDFQFRTVAASELRAELEGLSVQELQGRLTAMGVALPENSRNPRYLIRAIETGGQPHERSQLRQSTLVLGMQLDREVLRQRITERVDRMLGRGLAQEVGRLAERYGWDAQAMQAPGYATLHDYTLGTESLDEARARLVQSHLDLAKRQRTWFKRNKSIHWLTTEDKLAEAVDLATTFLNK